MDRACIHCAGPHPGEVTGLCRDCLTGRRRVFVRGPQELHLYDVLDWAEREGLELVSAERGPDGYVRPLAIRRAS